MAKTLSQTERLRKGLLVEAVVASLHEGPNLKVTKRARLRPLSGGRKNVEIDVLVTARAAGYEVQIAIECKNEKRPIGCGAIQKFESSLRLVGIGPNCGIFVSSSGFTKAALERARSLGIRCFSVLGLTKEQTAIQVHAAVQCMLFFVGEILSLSITSDVRSVAPVDLIHIFDNRTGNPIGSTIELLRAIWNRMPTGDEYPGLKEIVITPPAYACRSINGRYGRVHKITAVVRVSALAIRISGQRREVGLAHPGTRNLTRLKVDVEFDTNRRSRAEFFTSNDELKRHLESLGASLNLTVKRRLSRLLMNGFLWPLGSGQLEEIGRHLSAGGTLDRCLFERLQNSYNLTDLLSEDFADTDRIHLVTPADDSEVWRFQVSPISDRATPASGDER